MGLEGLLYIGGPSEVLLSFLFVSFCFLNLILKEKHCLNPWMKALSHIMVSVFTQGFPTWAPASASGESSLLPAEPPMGGPAQGSLWPLLMCSYGGHFQSTRPQQDLSVPHLAPCDGGCYVHLTGPWGAQKWGQTWLGVSGGDWHLNGWTEWSILIARPGVLHEAVLVYW